MEKSITFVFHNIYPHPTGGPKVIFEYANRLTDETPEMTEQTKINISPFLFAMMVLANKKVEDNINVCN